MRVIRSEIGIAISEINGDWVIDIHRCIDCGACLEICPADAIIVI